MCAKLTLVLLYSDINECDVLNGECSHYCYNTDGSYYCSCPVGYELINQKFCKGMWNVVCGCGDDTLFLWLTFNNLERDVLL